MLTLLCLAMLAAPAAVAGETSGKDPAAVYTPKETENFKTLAKATLEALDAGQKDEMVAKLTDLETAWDDQEDNLKPRDLATWTLLDKTLDKAISSLRSSHVDLVKGKKALNDLLKKLDQATKPASS